jgi:ribosomal protein S12 methylthiotransferase accessory factor YcaO
LTAFTAGREAAQERLRLITEKTDEQARLNKALRLSRVPDPRAFALHKAWLSSLPTREALKKPRDLNQAQAVASLVKG